MFFTMPNQKAAYSPWLAMSAQFSHCRTQKKTYSTDP